ncbi:GNAT family N-acetyltransferase [Vagococcus vulneris]|uniref:GNAT family N-acetyltransferase n=1 Tax=Vagococcus vulneris TaxID=1977869 RepID=A0A429ZX35_9ENTE|nr:GNAT family protein [Vagococcus vulneris]RST98298.1 GNAT family N-acetyltransferase [Vagococcus vulneris]
MLIANNNLTLRSYTVSDICPMWQLAYNDDLEWMKWNGPYFNDPILELGAYRHEAHAYFVDSPLSAVIEYDEQIIGQVFAYWDDGLMKNWLEFGICIYDSAYWNSGIGKQAIALWINHLFTELPDITRVGFTTWSGNTGMMAIGERLNMTQEARIRKVRVVNDVHYDSIRYGILREEWQATHLE